MSKASPHERKESRFEGDSSLERRARAELRERRHSQEDFDELLDDMEGDGFDPSVLPPSIRTKIARR